MHKDVCEIDFIIPHVLPEKYELAALKFTNMSDDEFSKIAYAAVNGDPDAIQLVLEFFMLEHMKRETKWRWLKENRDILVFECDTVDRGWAIEIEFSAYLNTSNESEPEIVFIEYFETYRQLKNKMKYFHLDRSKMIARKTFRSLCYD